MKRFLILMGVMAMAAVGVNAAPITKLDLPDSTPLLDSSDPFGFGHKFTVNGTDHYWTNQPTITIDTTSGLIAHTSNAAIHVSEAQASKIAAAITSETDPVASAELTQHENNTNNPHCVTAFQTGAATMTNVYDWWNSEHVNWASASWVASLAFTLTQKPFFADATNISSFVVSEWVPAWWLNESDAWTPATRTITLDGMAGSLSSNLVFSTGYGPRLTALEGATDIGATNAVINGVLQSYDPSTRIITATVEAPTVYTPISNVATGATVTVNVSPTQQIYSVATDARITLLTNDLSSVVIGGASNVSWDVWVDFRTWESIGGEELYMADYKPYIVPSVGWASNVHWADDLPEISTTGCYHFAFSTLDGKRILGRQTWPTPQKWQLLPFFSAVAANFSDGWTFGEWNNAAITNYAKFYDCFPCCQYKVLRFAFWRWANDAQGKYAIAYQNDGQITPTYATNTVIWAENFALRSTGYFPHWRTMWHKDAQAFGTHTLGQDVAQRSNFVMWYLGYAEANKMNRFYFQENSERPMNELEREQYDAGVRLPAGR